MTAATKPGQSWGDRLRHLPKRTQRVIAAAVLAVVALGAGWWAFADNGDSEGPRGQARTGGGMEGMAGMDMSSDGSVRLTAGQIREFGITFGTVEQQTLENEVRTVGVVNFDETRMAVVSPKFAGFVERLHVNFTGQPVRRGQPLLEIYSPELVAAQQELLVARRLQGTIGESAVPGVPAPTSDLVSAARRRLQLWEISAAQINEVLRTGRPRRTLTLYAPVGGIVMEKKVLRGQAVQAGEPLYTVADLSEVWIEAELREADAATVTEGSNATVEFAALPGRTYAGRVEYIYPTVEPEARTLKARITVPDPGGRLKPGMYATVKLSTPTRPALVAPSSAVIQTGERALVFVDMGGGKLMAHEVETGRVSGDYTEILSGLEPGQRVVTSAQFLLESESNLGEIMKSMVGMGGGGEMQGMEGMDMPAQSGSGMEDKGADMRGMKMPAERR